ncbi:hypothetical protein ACCO45_008368 [Purpureocillium lilacinum]|uniref:Uncharacterized protein n=1 Tax=Purpureocillium lilacinum TaxID=33203 RepID=A0ACC4DN47_PURLI
MDRSSSIGNGFLESPLVPRRHVLDLRGSGVEAPCKGRALVSSVSLSKIPGGSISPPHQGIIVTADQRAGAPQRRRLAPPKAGAPRRRSRKSLDSPNHGSGYRASAHVSSPGNLSLTKGSPAVPSRKAVPGGSDRVMSRSHKTCCPPAHLDGQPPLRCTGVSSAHKVAPRRRTASHWPKDPVPVAGWTGLSQVKPADLSRKQRDPACGKPAFASEREAKIPHNGPPPNASVGAPPGTGLLAASRSIATFRTAQILDPAVLTSNSIVGVPSALDLARPEHATSYTSTPWPGTAAGG